MARLSFLLSVLVYALTCLIAWFVLPERVPMHFTFDGSVDNWATHTGAMVTMVVLGGAMALLFWGLAVWVPRVPETLLNINAKDKKWWLSTPERNAELRRRLAADLYLIGAATMALLVFVELTTIWVSGKEEPALGGWFMVVPALYVVGILGYCSFLVTRRYRTPRDVE